MKTPEINTGTMNEDNKLRWLYRELGDHGWKKGNQAKLSMIKCSESGTGYAFSPTKTDSVTEQGWQWGWRAAGASPGLAWCYWSALLHKGDSSLLWWLQHPKRIAETFPSAMPSYSSNAACFQTRPQDSFGGAVWGHRRHPASLFSVEFLAFCHIDSFLANFQGKYIPDPKLCGLSMLFPHHKEPNCWNQGVPTNSK